MKLFGKFRWRAMHIDVKMKMLIKYLIRSSENYSKFRFDISSTNVIKINYYWNEVPYGTLET